MFWVSRWKYSGGPGVGPAAQLLPAPRAAVRTPAIANATVSLIRLPMVFLPQLVVRRVPRRRRTTPAQRAPCAMLPNRPREIKTQPRCVSIWFPAGSVMSSLAASRLRRAAATAITLACAAIAPSAAPAAGVSWMKGFSAPGTPARYNRVGVVKVGPVRSPNVLVLVPGTSAGGGYFVPLAKTVAAMVPGWQVWSVERRENLLEDHSMVNRAKAHRATALELFDYYLGYLNNPSITTHFQSTPDASVGFARQWGMRVEVEDLRRVVLSAQRLRRGGGPGGGPPRAAGPP